MDLENLVKGCVKMEKAVATIYILFMQLFPEERDFWEGLFRDEVDHASWLKDADYIDSFDLLPSEDLLPSLKHVENSLRFAEKRISQIRTNPVTFEEALNISLKLEETMVETFTNELRANLFASDYKSLSERLIIAEKLHIDKIEDMMIARGFLQLT